MARALALTRASANHGRICRPAVPSITLPIGSSVAQAERALMLATLRHFNHHKERTAAALGISLKTLYNRLKEYAAEGGD